MTIYGLRGFIHHGWDKLLTVMSPQGTSAALEKVITGDDIVTETGEGKLTQYYERGKGALDRMIEENGIIVLDRAAWNAKKAELGEAIWR